MLLQVKVNQRITVIATVMIAAIVAGLAAVASTVVLIQPVMANSLSTTTKDVPQALSAAIQSGLNQDADGIARAYFIQMGERAKPDDIGFLSEVFLRRDNSDVPVIERVMMTAYVPESYPDGMIIDFRTSFRKYFEEQGYQVVFGPAAAPSQQITNSVRPVFDLRFRRSTVPRIDVSDSVITANQPQRMSLFGTLQSAGAGLRVMVANQMDKLGRMELSLIAGAGAAVAFVILVMLALAPMRILRSRQLMKMRYRQYPDAGKIRGMLPPRGEPAVFRTGYVAEPSGSFAAVDPEVERIRATMSQLGIKEVLEILKNLDPHYRNQVLNGLNVHQSIKSRIEKALSAQD